LSILELHLDGLLDLVELSVGIVEQQVNLSLDLGEDLEVIFQESDGADSLFDLTDHLLEHGFGAELAIFGL